MGRLRRLIDSDSFVGVRVGGQGLASASVFSFVITLTYDTLTWNGGSVDFYCLSCSLVPVLLTVWRECLI